MDRPDIKPESSRWEAGDLSHGTAVVLEILHKDRRTYKETFAIFRSDSAKYVEPRPTINLHFQYTAQQLIGKVAYYGEVF